MSNTITAYFKGRVGVAESVYQNDYGIVMAFDSIDLPAHFDCYFSRLNQDEALPGLGADNRVTIPNSILASPGNVTIHIPLHTGEDDSEVEYVIYFKVIGRARPIDDGAPEEQSALSQAIALLQHVPSQIEDYFEAHIVPTVSQDVNDWLDEHPEATTTVQDGSLTEAKFSDALKLKAIKDYVTPEMFGAVGDGETDDSDAFVLAVATNKPIIGISGKRYVIKNITIHNTKIYNCEFSGGGTDGWDGFNVKSGCQLVNCRFTLFRNAIYNTDTVVASGFYSCVFAYCKNGIYFDCSTNSLSVNCVRIKDCYFSKCGTSVDDTTASYTEGHGYGIYANGNINGLIITGNVFEYNSYCGIYLINTSNLFRFGAFVTSNYFEGNKNCAIYVKQTLSDNMISIYSNYFSSILTNVFNTRYCNYQGGLSICKMIANGEITSYSNTLQENLTHLITDHSIYLTLYPTYSPSNRSALVRIVYSASLNPDRGVLTLKDSTGSTDLFTFQNGYHEEVFEVSDSYLFSRSIDSIDSITIYSFTYL